MGLQEIKQLDNIGMLGEALRQDLKKPPKDSRSPRE